MHPGGTEGMSLVKIGVAAFALIATTLTAQAQNMPAKVAKGPYYGSPPVHQWTGFYGGLNVGYGLAGITDNLPLAVTTLMHGVFGGAQLGYNYQTGAWVYGLEADIQASDLSTSYSQNLPIVGNVTAGHKIPYFGTFRGRLGYAFTCGCVMAYATAGLAYGAYEPFASAGGITVSQRYTNAALAAGAGVEWMIAERWSTKLEALYFDTGTIGSGVTLPIVGEINARVRATITRLGLNYHF
jgi:outer membrane immunogenic protein